MKKLNYDTVIIGSGAAGLFSAIKLSKRQDFRGKILILTKCPLAESNSRYAQGGIAAYIKENPSDSLEKHIEDTLKSGAGLCDKGVVEYIIQNSQKTIDELVNLKAGFDCDEKGNFSYTLGGAHSAKRVLHSGQDKTGMVMMEALSNEVKKAQNIDVIAKTIALELVVEDKICKGVFAFDKNSNEYILINCPNIIIATGGCCQIYKYTTNPYGATGDGIALAYSAGAKIKDMEFIQFHPTALVLNKESKSRYLISEALRGEGAKLVNSKNIEFMAEYCDKKELSSRDVVTRAIFQEMKKENTNRVFLDASKINSDTVLKRFPTIAKKCKTIGIDITKDLIPVAPAAHYMIGGIEVDLFGQTEIKGLYAVGEVACTGFQGANRLASNSLLECVVCAQKLTQDFKCAPKSEIKDYSFVEKYNKSSDKKDYQNKKTHLRELMWNKVGIIREKNELLSAKDELEWLIEEVRNENNIDIYEYKNMLIVSYLITICALNREESRGAHYRGDYPQVQNEIFHSIIHKEKGGIYERI